MDCKNWIPVCLPEEQGIPSHAILWFLDQVECEGLDLHSLQIVRNGKMVVDTVAAPFTHNSFHRIYSAAKGMVATAILFAIQDRYYSLDEKVVPKIPAHWLPEDLDPRWNSLTLYHLLTMNTGHDKDTLFEMWGKSDCWIKTFFQVKPTYEPGTYFCYDMGAQYVMNELVRLATGKDTGQYLQEKLLSKLGIEYQVNYTEPEGLFFSSSIQLKPDALTKLSLFYLQKGCWNGEQLLKPELAEALGAHQTPSRHYEYVRSGQPFTDDQKKTLIITGIVIGLVIIPGFCQMFFPNPVTAFLKAKLSIQLLAAVGTVVMCLMRLANFNQVLKNRVPWGMIVTICGMTHLMALSKDLGVADFFGAILQERVPAGLIVPALILITGILTYFVDGQAVTAIVLPMLPVLVEVSGTTVGAIMLAYLMNVTASFSPFSTGGAMALSGCPEELRQKCINIQIYLPWILLAVSVLVGATGLLALGTPV